MKRAEVISKTLNDMFPHAKVELNFANTFELLVAVVLSAQTTDISVNKVTPSLFFQYPTPKDLKDAPLEKIEQLIRSIGLYRNKAKNIKELARIIDEVYEGTVPSDRERLESLPGVGRKTTNVVLSNAFNIPAFAVDTHAACVSTANAGMLKALLKTTFVVFLPTPGRLSKRSLSLGTVPSYTSSMIRASSLMFFALLRYNPIERINCSIFSRGASFKSFGVGY